MSGADQKTIEMSKAEYPRWSIDGKRVRFIVWNPAALAGSIWECDRDGSHLHRVVDERYGSIAGESAWTADGRLFVFRHFNTQVSSDLWALPEGLLRLSTAPVPLTKGPLHLSSPASSRTSNALFAVGQKARGELVRFEPNANSWASFLGGISAIDLNFSRDGQWVSYQHFPEHALWRRRTDGSSALQLTPQGLEAFQPHWSPGGKLIAFMGHRPGGPYCIYIVAADGSNLHELKPDDPFDQGVPSWSADGRLIVFGELRERKPDSAMVIRTIDVATKAESLLPDSKGKWSPRWSPDGNYIVASTTDFSSLALYDVHNRTWHTLIHGLKAVDDAAWSADSKFVYFRHTPPGANEQSFARINIATNRYEFLTRERSMPPWYYDWFTVAPDGSLLVLKLTKIDEIYALDLGWR